MIFRFIRERLSWILFFLFAHALLLFISFVDSAIPFNSILYFAGMSFISFLIFLAVRYHRESYFYKSLEDRVGDLDPGSIPAPSSPFEKTVEEAMSEQSTLLKKEARDLHLALETEKDQLLAWIHEVKTPLTALHLMIERMEDGPLKSSLTYEWLRIHLLLDQQLHQKRIPFIENDLYIQKIDLEEIIHHELLTMKAWCIQKGIGFDISLEETEVLTDGKWLAFIIRQILTNSIKYSDAGDIKIKSWKQSGQSRLEIRDSGRGIDPRDLPRIFDKGFTSTTKHEDHASTGMGLYLTKKAAVPLLIEIEVQSTLGEGTAFTLLFPKRNDFSQVISM
jgi:two-component system, OmpR family, bacitracin resistance sensor histidine kinase BceS